MNITDRAKAILQGVLEQQGANGIRLTTVSGCCGPQLSVSLDEPEITDQVQMINDIRVAFDSNLDLTDEITIDAEKNADGEGLVLLGSSNCC